MIGKTNTGGGGKIKDTNAILTVTVPTGSTVTMTKGGTTLTPTMWVQAADPTRDCALFVIAPSLFDAQNAWTVTATSGINSASATITIDSNEQYNIKLYFRLFIVRDGNLEATILDKTSGITDEVSGGRYIVSKTSSGSRVHIKYGTFDLVGKGYTKLALVFDKLSGSGDTHEAGFEIYNSLDSRIAEYYHASDTKYDTETTWQINISSINTQVSVKLGQFGNYSGTWTMKIKNFYFE